MRRAFFLKWPSGEFFFSMKDAGGNDQRAITREKRQANPQSSLSPFFLRLPRFIRFHESIPKIKAVGFLGRRKA